MNNAKIVQIAATRDTIFVLLNDGTIWAKKNFWDDSLWVEVSLDALVEV